MIARTLLVTVLVLSGLVAISQENTAGPDLFEKLTKSAKEYRLDTSSPPADRITKKITELRQLRGGFNINEVIEFKIEEDKQKNDISADEAARRSAFFRTGNGRRWLDNAVTWIYRRNFTYAELKQLVKFYKTTAGQKIAVTLPVLMIESLKAGETIVEIFKQSAEKKH